MPIPLLRVGKEMHAERSKILVGKVSRGVQDLAALGPVLFRLCPVLKGELEGVLTVDKVMTEYVNHPRA